MLDVGCFPFQSGDGLDAAGFGWSTGAFDVSVGRFDSLQVPHEKVLGAALSDWAAGAVVRARNDEQIKIFAAFHERVHQSHRGFRRHVGVELAPDQQEMAAEFAGVVDV